MLAIALAISIVAVLAIHRLVTDKGLRMRDMRARIRESLALLRVALNQVEKFQEALEEPDAKAAELLAMARKTCDSLSAVKLNSIENIDELQRLEEELDQALLSVNLARRLISGRLKKQAEENKKD